MLPHQGAGGLLHDPDALGAFLHEQQQQDQPEGSYANILVSQMPALLFLFSHLDTCLFPCSTHGMEVFPRGFSFVLSVVPRLIQTHDEQTGAAQSKPPILRRETMNTANLEAHNSQPQAQGPWEQPNNFENWSRRTHSQSRKGSPCTFHGTLCRTAQLSIQPASERFDKYVSGTFDWNLSRQVVLPSAVPS